MVPLFNQVLLLEWERSLKALYQLSTQERSHLPWQIAMNKSQENSECPVSSARRGQWGIPQVMRAYASRAMCKKEDQVQ
jgi:hypothetical protein